MFDEAIDAEYNIRKRHPESPQHYARYQADSAAARAGLARSTGARLDLAYGDAPGERLDVFPAAVPGGPVFVFIHGGYWRALDKSDFSFLAPAFVNAGIATVLVNYDLTPAVEVEAIVAQVQRALRWLRADPARTGGDLDRLHVGGHSAGGQLTAMAMLAGLPMAAGLAWSGVFDLEPLLRTNVNVQLRLDAPRARALSPQHSPAPLGAPLFVAVGGAETTGFIDQSQRFAAARGLDCRIYPGLDHYTIMTELARPDSAVHRDALRVMLG